MTKYYRTRVILEFVSRKPLDDFMLEELVEELDEGSFTASHVIWEDTENPTGEISREEALALCEMWWREEFMDEEDSNA